MNAPDDVVEKFKQMLQRHDWTYMMSDDHRWYVAGQAEENRIMDMIKKYPDLEPLYRDEHKRRWKR